MITILILLSKPQIRHPQQISLGYNCFGVLEQLATITMQNKGCGNIWSVIKTYLNANTFIYTFSKDLFSGKKKLKKKRLNCNISYLAYIICNAVRTWESACCLARLPSIDSRIFASDGRFGLALFTPLILLLEEDEDSGSEGTPTKRNSREA